MGMRRASGGAVVLRDLLDALCDAPSIESVTLFASPARTRQFSIPDHPLLIVREREDGESRLGLLHWVSTGLKHACLAEATHGLVSLNALGSPGVPMVVLFQQQLMFAPAAVRLMPLPFRARLAVLRRMAERACRRARLVVAQAPHVATSLVDQFGVERHRVRVVMPDVHWPAGVPGSVSPSWFDEPSLLYIGTDRPYKSLDTLISALAVLRARRPRLQLAVTLPADHPASRVAGVRCLGTLPREAIRTVLQQATALLMPSLAETLGLPLLEALDVGCPIAAANLPYARDVCGNAAIYFEPRSVSSCVAACEALLSEQGLTARLSEAGRARMLDLRRAEPSRVLADSIYQAITSDAATASGTP